MFGEKNLQTFTGFATTTPVGSCSDSFAVAGTEDPFFIRFSVELSIFLPVALHCLALQAKPGQTHLQFVERTPDTIVSSDTTLSIIGSQSEVVELRRGEDLSIFSEKTILGL